MYNMLSHFNVLSLMPAGTRVFSIFPLRWQGADLVGREPGSVADEMVESLKRSMPTISTQHVQRLSANERLVTNRIPLVALRDIFYINITCKVFSLRFMLCCR